MSSIVNDVLFVDSHIEASLKLLFQLLEDITGVRLSRDVTGCPLTVLHSTYKKGVSLSLSKETQNFSPCNCTPTARTSWSVSCLNINVHCSEIQNRRASLYFLTNL
jgi:hypothetical protein